MVGARRRKRFSEIFGIHLLGDKKCPKCNSPNSVFWRSIGVVERGGKIVEWGRFVCDNCGWASELRETEIEEIADGKF